MGRLTLEKKGKEITVLSVTSVGGIQLVDQAQKVRDSHTFQRSEFGATCGRVRVASDSDGCD
jgi:hypothetical protein